MLLQSATDRNSYRLLWHFPFLLTKFCDTHSEERKNGVLKIRELIRIILWEHVSNRKRTYSRKLPIIFHQYSARSKWTRPQMCSLFFVKSELEFERQDVWHASWYNYLNVMSEACFKFTWNAIGRTGLALSLNNAFLSISACL